MLQLACLWNLTQEPVKSVVPTLIQESRRRRASRSRRRSTNSPRCPTSTLSADEVEELRRIGDNTGCMDLKGGNPEHIGEPLPDRWSLTNDLTQVAERWNIQPARDLVCTHAKAAA